MSVDIFGTSWDQCRSKVQYSFTSTETGRLVGTDSPGRPPRLSHISWTMMWVWTACCLNIKNWRDPRLLHHTGLRQVSKAILRMAVTPSGLHILYKTLWFTNIVHNLLVYMLCIEPSGLHVLCRIHLVYMYCAEPSGLHVLFRIHLVYIYCAKPSGLHVLCRIHLVYMYCAEPSGLHVLYRPHLVYVYCK